MHLRASTAAPDYDTHNSPVAIVSAMSSLLLGLLALAGADRGVFFMDLGCYPANHCWLV